jgi:MscS family membrane protein
MDFGTFFPDGWSGIWEEHRALVELFAKIMTTYLVVLIINWILTRVLARLRAALPGTQLWRRSWLRAVGAPLRLITWLIALVLVVNLILLHFKVVGGAVYSFRFMTFVVVISITWFLLRWRKQVELLWPEVKGTNEIPGGIPLYVIGKVFSVVITVLSSLIIIQSFDIDLVPLLAFGGVVGGAAAFAAKDVLSSFFAGFMLYIVQPFKIGDWVQINDGKFEGTVEEIGWYQTMIRDFAKRPMYLPNSMFTSGMLINPSRMSNRRIKEFIGLRYCDHKQMMKILTEIKGYIRGHEEIDTKMTILVNFSKFGPSSLDIMLYCFTKTTNWAKWLDIQQEIFLHICEIIESHGAEIAFPTTTLDIPGDPECLSEFSRKRD